MTDIFSNRYIAANWFGVWNIFTNLVGVRHGITNPFCVRNIDANPTIRQLCAFATCDIAAHILIIRNLLADLPTGHIFTNAARRSGATDATSIFDSTNHFTRCFMAHHLARTRVTFISISGLIMTFAIRNQMTILTACFHVTFHSVFRHIPAFFTVTRHILAFTAIMRFIVTILLCNQLVMTFLPGALDIATNLLLIRNLPGAGCVDGLLAMTRLL